MTMYSGDEYYDDDITSMPIHIHAADLFDWADARDELEDAGYERGAPGGSDEIDAHVARATICPICGRTMDYVGYRGDDGDYYAFAVCRPCDKALEF